MSQVNSETTSEDQTNSKSRNVVVTGFGLFRDHKSNPSWDAIKDGKLKIDRPNINVITKQINVCYEEVDRVVEEIWTKYDPLIVVHVGLNASANSIRLEQHARHGPFIHDDVSENAPHKHLRQYGDNNQSVEENVKVHIYSCKSDCNFDSTKTCFDLERVCRQLSGLHTQGNAPIPYESSQDAGLYVCEYVYQKSLRICDRAVFIHVPDVGNKFTIEDIRLSLKYAIEALVDETNEISC